MDNSLAAYFKPLLAALVAALYLRFLLPVTAILFYELYHATGIDFIYWGYSVFKVAGYYFGAWKYQTLACAIVGVSLFALLAWLGRRGRTNTGASA